MHRFFIRRAFSLAALPSTFQSYVRFSRSDNSCWAKTTRCETPQRAAMIRFNRVIACRVDSRSPSSSFCRSLQIADLHVPHVGYCVCGLRAGRWLQTTQRAGSLRLFDGSFIALLSR